MFYAENTPLKAPNSPADARPISIPAIITPPIHAIKTSLNFILRSELAKVPVQAPVPGSGIPTKSKRAITSPLPAFSWSFCPPFSPFSTGLWGLGQF